MKNPLFLHILSVLDLTILDPSDRPEAHMMEFRKVPSLQGLQMKCSDQVMNENCDNLGVKFTYMQEPPFAISLASLLEGTSHTTVASPEG